MASPPRPTPTNDPAFLAGMSYAAYLLRSAGQLAGDIVGRRCCQEEVRMLVGGVALALEDIAEGKVPPR